MGSTAARILCRDPRKKFEGARRRSRRGVRTALVRDRDLGEGPPGVLRGCTGCPQRSCDPSRDRMRLVAGGAVGARRPCAGTGDGSHACERPARCGEAAGPRDLGTTGGASTPALHERSRPRLQRLATPRAMPPCPGDVSPWRSHPGRHPRVPSAAGWRIVVANRVRTAISRRTSISAA